MSVAERKIKKTNQGEHTMSAISSNLILLVVGGILFVSTFYIFFVILFSKDKSYPTNTVEKKSIKPFDRNINTKAKSRA